MSRRALVLETSPGPWHRLRPGGPGLGFLGDAMPLAGPFGVETHMVDGPDGPEDLEIASVELFVWLRIEDTDVVGAWLGETRDFYGSTEVPVGLVPSAAIRQYLHHVEQGNISPSWEPWKGYRDEIYDLWSENEAYASEIAKTNHSLGGPPPTSEVPNV